MKKSKSYILAERAAVIFLEESSKAKSREDYALARKRYFKYAGENRTSVTVWEQLCNGTFTPYLSKKRGPKVNNTKVALIDNNGQVKQIFNSIDEAAKSLYVSKRTVMGYLEGKVQKPIYNLRYLDNTERI